MKRILALVGLIALLSAPAAELAHDHDHDLGHAHTDCPACQLKSNPAESVAVQTAPVGELGYPLGVLTTPPAPRPMAHPLRVAPKTSPPSVFV